MKELTGKQQYVKTFTWLVVAAGAAICVYSAYQLSSRQFDLRFLLLALFTIGFGSRLTIQMPRAKVHLSVSDAFVFLILLLYGGEAAIIVAAAMNQAIEPAGRALGPTDFAQGRGIAHEQVEQRHRVGRRPFASFPRPVPTDRPRRRQPHQRHPAVQVHDRHRPRRMEADPPPRTVGQARFDAAHLQPFVELVEHGGERRGDKPPDQAAAIDEQPS